MLIDSGFAILPGEIRQVPLASFDSTWIFRGFVRTSTSFDVVEVRSSSGKPISISLISGDCDPDIADFASLCTIVPPGVGVLFFIKNTGNRPAKYHTRIW
jgi:hypothetical protein